MKKALLLSALYFFFCFASNATTHNVNVSNFQFSPNSMTVFVGDVIHFQWVNGSHTATCDPAASSGCSLPSGATTFDGNMRSSSPTLDYTVTVVGTYNYVCLPHEGGGMIGNFTAQTLVPLKLFLFTVEGANENANLVWKTATEQNTDHFVVKRSLDGTKYSEVATIAASGFSTTEKTYSFSDSKLPNQKYLYYSITTIDKDGRQQVSDVRLFKNTKASNGIVLTLSPNPITTPGHLNMTFNADKEGKMLVKVINAEGKTIINRNMQAYTGVNKGHIHLGDQPAGVYTVQCTMDDVTESFQVVYK